MATHVLSHGLDYTKGLLFTMRPQQWTKNVLIFPALVFSQKLLVWSETAKVLSAFVVFCFLSSSIYVLNDLLDLENDRVHPTKCRRPLASGLLPVPLGIAAFVVLSASSLIASWFLGWHFFLVGLAYYVLQIAYSTRLKHMVILDVFCIAAGFVLRAVAGGEVLNVTISTWLLICAMLLSLFLAMGKRRHELLLLEDGATAHRKILAEYSPEFLDQMISVVTAATVVCYCLYTISSETAAKFPNLKFTIPFVLYGIFRYFYLIHQRNLGGSPEKALLNDPSSLVNLGLYAVACGIILYVR
ncbi:MAG: decaprenyl-phosphate phosphoribosyltransferase [Blastocatellia bacterium]|nr:decaprenyl-phosphate phosphoribosyltransferase [Blastocatellia bacterium]